MTDRPAELWVGRDEVRARPWMEIVRRAGWRARACPLVEVSALDPGPEGHAALRELGSFHWIFFTSAASVERVAELRGGAPWPPGLRAAVVGPATGAALEARGLRPALEADGAGGAGLARAFLALHLSPEGLRLIWPAAAEALPDLEEILRGARYTLLRVAVYRARSLSGPAPPPGVPLLLFSPSAVAALRVRVQEPERHPLWAIGPATAAAAAAAGFPVPVVLSVPTPEGLEQCLGTRAPS